MSLIEDAKALKYDLEGDRNLRRLKFANQELKARGDALAKAVERLEHEREILLGLRDRKPIRKLPAPRRIDKGEACGVLLLSDWHVEEQIRADEVNGINEWSLEIADKVIPEVFARAIRVTDRYRSMAKIDELLVMLGGDFITGHLRDEQLSGNVLTPIRACQFAEDHIRSGLEQLLRKGRFKKITVVTVTGNHGRTTEKLWASGRNDTSYETLVYEHLRKSMTDKRLEWRIGDGQFAYVDVYGWRARIVHGDCFKYKGGIGGMSVPVNKMVDRWDADRKTRADMTFFGHLHNFCWNAPNRWICNGALPGSGPYSLTYGANEPCQAYAVVDRGRGLTDATKIFAR